MKHKNSKGKSKLPEYPSSFGSHHTMLADEYKEWNDGGNPRVVCEDSHGVYVTTRAILDTGFADYNRSAPTGKREKLLAEFKAEQKGTDT